MMSTLSWFMTAAAGVWQPTELLQGVFVVASPPEAPAVAVNSAGHAISVWSNTGAIRFSERVAGGTWTAGANVRAGANGGPAVVAIGSDDTAAAAWVTVATQFVPAKLVASVRAPGAKFPAWSEVALGTGVWYVDLAIAGDGTTHVAWQDAAGIEWSTMPPGGVWSAPVLISDPVLGGAMPDLAVNDTGDLVAVWTQGVDVGTAYLPAGGVWELPTTLVSANASAWNARAGIDSDGGAAVGWLDGTEVAVATRTALGPWDPSVRVSAGQSATWSSFSMSDQGDLLAAWQASGATTSVWATTLAPGGAWTAPVQLSSNVDQAGWPTAAWSNDATVAIVGWSDDLAVVSRASIGTPGAAGMTWTRVKLGGGSWGSTVPVAAGGGVAASAWATQLKANPNSAKILGKAWQ